MLAKIVSLSILLLGTPTIHLHENVDMISESHDVAMPVTVKISGRVDDDAARRFAKDMEAAHETGQPIIIVEIDTYGGSLYSMNAMIDTFKRSKVPVATVVTSKAMSAGVALMSCGTEGMRYAAPTSTIMVHEGSTAAMGKMIDIKTEADELDRLNRIMLETISVNIGKGKDYIKNIIHSHGHADWYLTPEDALKHNLINHIGVPEYHVDITVKTTIR